MKLIPALTCIISLYLSYLSFEKENFTSIEQAFQETGKYDLFLVFVNDASHLTKCFSNSMQNDELFNGQNTYSLNDLRTIKCTVGKEMLEEILDVVTDKAPDRRDRHSDEYIREIHDERMREIIGNQSIILPL